MGRVAIVTDSASDFDPARAASLGITIVPLVVSFGDETFSAGTNLSREQFWAKVKTPGTPIATTAACSPGTFQTAYQAAFDAGADVDRLDPRRRHALGHAQGGPGGQGLDARSRDPDRRLDVRLDGRGDARRARGRDGERGQIRRARSRDAVEARRADLQVYLALETLEYLKRGGRISGPQAAIGTLLSIKPIIEIKNGKVEVTERVRTRGKVRERLIELFMGRPDRAPLGPPHHRRRRRAVRRRDHEARRPAAVPGDDRPGRPIGRAAPRPGLRRGRGAVQGELAGHVPARSSCSRGRARLRQGCETVPTASRRSADSLLDCGDFHGDPWIEPLRPLAIRRRRHQNHDQHEEHPLP